MGHARHTSGERRLSSRIPHERAPERKMIMVWTTPTLIEISIGLEINGYLPAEF
jgi:coenzyme PQQ precursor peptide PqqA